MVCRKSVRRKDEAMKTRRLYQKTKYAALNQEGIKDTMAHGKKAIEPRRH